MKMIPSPDPTNELLERKVTEDGTLEMGAYRVLFGWRVCAGKVGDTGYFANWCCGADQMLVFATLGLLAKFIEADVYKQLPGFPKIKPWVNDVEFVSRLQAIADEIKLEINIFGLSNIFRNPKYGNNDTTEKEVQN